MPIAVLSVVIDVLFITITNVKAFAQKELELHIYDWWKTILYKYEK